MFPILKIPSRISIQKLEKAVSISFAEKAVLQHRVDELTAESSAKRRKTDLDQSILFQSRLITMEDVNRIREEKSARKN